MNQIIIDQQNVPDPCIRCQTKQGNDISNNQICKELPLSDLNVANKLKEKYNFQTYRTNPCGYYNCHGLTFASRRTRIWETKEIAKILQDDNYKIIEEEKTLPGDIVIYFYQGDAQHSGIVLDKQDLGIIILSKWGSGPEVIHDLRACPYSLDADRIYFYRVESIHHGAL